MIDPRRLTRYILVGVSSAVVLLGLTWLFVDGLHLPVILGSTIAVTLTALYNYCLHYYWTFSSNTPHGLVLVKYLVMAAGAILVNALIMHFGVKMLSIHYLIVQFLANIAVVTWSFTVSSLWVFRGEKAD
jgi:putative flippase GtrA